MAAPVPSNVRRSTRWGVQLLGGLSARNGDLVITRFPSRQIAMLFARIVMQPHRSHAREELAELLWPEVAPERQRNRLRHALSTLRGLLEPPHASPGSCLLIDRLFVRVHAGAFECDAVVFEQLVQAGDERAAAAAYRGDLLPGFYAEWVLEERARLFRLRERLDPMAEPDPDSRSPRHAEASRRVVPPAPRRTLPGYFTTFFGRDREVESLASDVAAHRLVTLTGAGGCGKTRLSVEMASGLGGFDPVAFVSLAECRDGSQAIDAVRAAIGLQAGVSSTLAQIVQSLRDRRALLVLDNFEQLVAADGGAVVANLLELLPMTHLLVTSRRPLSLRGEHRVALQPLPLLDNGTTLAVVSRNPGIALFVDRARAVRADFVLGKVNAAFLVDVCALLDGLPLAIEIAASRVRTFTPREMRLSLQQSFAWVAKTGPGSSRSPRHSSLRAAIAWSWELLDAGHRRLLAGLAVCRDGWTPALALAVSGDANSERCLRNLVADSLVRADESRDGLDRFSMYASVREFARDAVDECDAATYRSRHRRHCLAWAAALDVCRRSPAEADLPNLVEALQTALRDSEPSVAVGLVTALQGHWLANGTTPEALDALGRLADEDSPCNSTQRSAIAALLARLLMKVGRPQEALARSATALRASQGDDAAHAGALLADAGVRWMWRHEGGAVIEPAQYALRLARLARRPDLEAQACLLLGAIALWHEHRPDEADRWFEQAARSDLILGDPRVSLPAWPGRVACLTALGRHHEAIELALAGIERAAALQNVETQLLLLNRLSLSYERLRRFADALAVCRRQVRLAQRHGMTYLLAYGLWNQCRPLARLRQPEPSAVMMAFSQRYWTVQFGPLDANDLRSIEKMQRLVVSQIGPARWRSAWERGLGMRLQDGIDLGSH